MLRAIPPALEPAAAAVSLNGLDNTVRVRPLQWGEKGAAARVLDDADDDGNGDNGGGDNDTPPTNNPAANAAAQSAANKRGFDLVLCSDLIYGDEEPSRLLVQTLLEVSAQMTTPPLNLSLLSC